VIFTYLDGMIDPKIFCHYDQAKPPILGCMPHEFWGFERWLPYQKSGTHPIYCQRDIPYTVIKISRRLISPGDVQVCTPLGKANQMFSEMEVSMNGPLVVMTLFFIRLVVPFIILMTLGTLIDRRSRQLHS